MERIIAFSLEHVLVPNALQFHRNFRVPAVFPQRSGSVPFRVPFAFTVKLLLSGTVYHDSDQLESSLATLVTVHN